MGVRSAAYRKAGPRPPRVCLCILMNHPFPRNLPLLREIYLGKFSHLRFLVPFERLDDPDVITVYRGSYTHAGYITDAYHRLKELDCDHLIFCHDDVLLNPQIKESSFAELFPLGPHDGFISEVISPPTYVGNWSWYFGMIPKLLHPKSMLFGTGVEYPSLLKHLPSARFVEEKLIQNGAGYVKEVRFSEAGFGEIEAEPSKVLLDGLHRYTDPNDPRGAALEALNLDICRKLVASLKLSAQLWGRGGGTEAGEHAVDLPIPLTTAGSFADLYIVPKSRLADYAHYVGVASAANLFVEVLAPTLLIASCEKVWRADELGLDASGLRDPPPVEAFADRRVLGIHPFKMAAMANADKRALLAKLRTLAGDPNPQMPVACPGGVEGSLFDLQGPEAQGWHVPDGWGAWTFQALATIRFHYDTRAPLGGVRLRLSLPTHPKLGKLSGWVALNGKRRRITAEWPSADADVDFPAKGFRKDAPNLIEFHADRLVRPADLEPEGGEDLRQLGVGLKGMNFY